MPVFSHLEVPLDGPHPGEETRTPMRLAYDTLRTEPLWFDGVDPATGWAITLLRDGVDWPGELEDRVRPAVWLGYRMGRIGLGDGPHPSFDRPELTDLFGAALHLMTTDALNKDSSWGRGDDAPELTSEEHSLGRMRAAFDMVAGVLANDGSQSSGPLATESAQAIGAVLLPAGLVLALAEDRLARSRR